MISPRRSARRATLVLFAAVLGIPACSGPFTTGGEESEDGGTDGVETASGGTGSSDSSGGASTDSSGGSGPSEASGGALTDSSGGTSSTGGTSSSGGQEGTGGSSGPTPPYFPNECQNFTCGTATLSFVAGVVYCLNIQPPATTAGNLTDSDTGTKPGNCIATLDGEPEDVSNGIAPGQLLIWGCNGWLNCY